MSRALAVRDKLPRAVDDFVRPHARDALLVDMLTGEGFVQIHALSCPWTDKRACRCLPLTLVLGARA